MGSFRKCLPIALLLFFGIPAMAQQHRHRPKPKTTAARSDRGKFDINDGRLREDIYKSGFGPTNFFFGIDAVWHGEPTKLGSRFMVNNFWFEINDFEWPEVFTPGQVYSIVWVEGHGYFLCSPQYPGVHVPIFVVY